jgi:hypothetical protein
MASHGDLAVLQLVADLAAKQSPTDTQALADALQLSHGDPWSNLQSALQPLQREGLLDIGPDRAGPRRLAVTSEGYFALAPHNSL